MLANDPALILADEPTGNLDPETSASIMDFLVELNGEGRTIVMVTHDLRVADRAKRALRLVNGSIQADGCARPMPATAAFPAEQEALSIE
jgi:ABC-type lipoprotein export system ATPase subunit